MTQRVLFIFSQNFLSDRDGWHKCLVGLAQSLKERGAIIDFLSAPESSYERKTFTIASFEACNAQTQLIDNFYFFDFTKMPPSSSYKCKILGRTLFHIKNTVKFFSCIFFGIRFLKNKYSHPNYADQLAFSKRVIYENKYDCVYFFEYDKQPLKKIPFLPELVRTVIQSGSRALYVMLDLYFVQSFYRLPHRAHEIGVFLQEELEFLRLFDRIACVSYDEKVFCEKFLPHTPCYFLPTMVGEPAPLPADQIKDIDILFLASNNPYNKEALTWFSQYVKPLLLPQIRVVVVGDITRYLSRSNTGTLQKQGIVLQPFAADLDALMGRVKITICPMQGGTGIKSKVLTSMIRGIPVVCTSRGVDGLPDKYESGCLVTDQPAVFADYIHRLLDDTDFYAYCSARVKQYYDTYLSAKAHDDTLEVLMAPKLTVL